MIKLRISVCNNFLDKSCSIDYTFAAETRGAYSIIDYFFVSNLQPNFVRSLSVLHDVDNLSDHLPLCLELQNDIITLCRSDSHITAASNRADDPTQRAVFDWLRGDRMLYYELTRLEFAALHELLSSQSIDDLRTTRPDLLTHAGINDVYRNIVHVLLNSSAKAIPVKSNASHVKYWWDSSLKDAKINCIKCHNAWVAAGRPNHGDLFSAKNVAKKSYKKAIFEKKNKSKKCVTTKLQNQLLKVDSKRFWRTGKASLKAQSVTIN